MRAKVDHPFCIVKQQSGYAKVRYRGLAKNTAQPTMLFALGNLWRCADNSSRLRDDCACNAPKRHRDTRKGLLMRQSGHESRPAAALQGIELKSSVREQAGWDFADLL